MTNLYVFIPMLAAIIIPFLYKNIKKIHTGWFVLIVPIFLVITYGTFIPNIMTGRTIVSEFTWIPSLGINFTSYIDGLGLLFSMLITGIGALVVLYSIYYLDKKREKLHNFYVYLLMFMTAMLGVVQSDNVITLYLFWELTSISSFLLIGYWYTRDRSRFGALKSMLITVFGGLFMLGGFVLLGIMGGTYSIRELIAQTPDLTSHPYFTSALILILIGAFTKSAQFPFYIWLPDAMEAPTPVSAYLHSATMVKAGIYLVARLTPIFAFSNIWSWLIIGIGLFTLLWASIFAAKQKDLKAILAFSTVSQLGLIMSLLGIGALTYQSHGAEHSLFAMATFAAIFHLINHATFKGSLFMIAGIVDHETGTRDIQKLGGLMSMMPISFTIALIGAFSMAGIPLFNGFLSKEMFLTSILTLTEFSWGTLAVIVATVASIFTFVYSLYFVFHTFAGKYKQDVLPKQAKEAQLGMLISPGILGALVVIIFFIPNVVSERLIKPAVSAIQPLLYPSPQAIDITISAWHGMNTEFYLTVIIFLVGGLLFISLKKWDNVYSKWPESLTLNRLYDGMLALTETGTNRLSRAVMTGFIRSYLMYMLIFMASLIISTLFLKRAFVIDVSTAAPIQLYAVITAIVVVAATITILFAKSRLTAIISLGAVGYSVALLYVIFRAPDLALTQLVIETVSVALFLLAFYHLPKLSQKEKPMKFRLGNAIVSISVGVMVTLVALAAQSQKAFPSISEYYKETVATEAGGGNIVNVILVDYRGFDTLFEITVLAIAGLGIYGLIKLRLSRKEKNIENK